MDTGVLLVEQDIRDLARGTAFLGSGGGGDPHAVVLQLLDILQKSGQIRLINMADLPHDALVAPCGWMGAPTVGEEKLPNGREPVAGLRMLEHLKGRKVDALIASEIGGSNGLAAMVLAAAEGLPVVDGDGMGRAFPEAQMVTYNIYGLSPNPVVFSDSNGNCLAMEAVNAAEGERIGRQIAVMMGGACHVFDFAASGYEIKQYAVRGTVSLAVNIGRAIREAKASQRDPFEALFSCLRSTGYYNHAGILFDGRIVDLQRNTVGGFSIGSLTIEAFGDSGETVKVEFQNENLKAYKGGQLLATVPDIISVLDRETADTITTEKLKYGQRVKLVGTSVPPILRTPEALAILGPLAFGFPEIYCPIEQLNNWI
ncbi:DUF917 domain-containing protein [Govanella unica]|uniref:DUF917 domain-containing protein n=1 Tax=Govanella unica TaxID=2975056 RepID=A0A9X3Z767_9PROT|nr:DUF917 domain-containing protein [Govania unica]MDA5193832.1 DUF917 domain-containing protein [Govania unica]